MDAPSARIQILLDALDEPTVSKRVQRLTDEIRVARLVDALRPFLLSANPPPRPAPKPVVIPRQRRPLPPEVIRAAHASQAKFGRNRPGRSQ